MLTRQANPRLASHAPIDRRVSEFMGSTILSMKDDSNVKMKSLKVMASRLRRHMRNFFLVSVIEISENSTIRGMRFMMLGIYK